MRKNKHLHIQFIYDFFLAGECKFPDEWIGRWYQKDLGELVIQKNFIQKKGECAEKKKDHYILFNR